MFGIDVVVIVIYRFDKMITRLVIVLFVEPVFSHEPFKVRNIRVFLKALLQQLFPCFPFLVRKMLLYNLGILLRCLESVVGPGGRGYQ